MQIDNQATDQDRTNLVLVRPHSGYLFSLGLYTECLSTRFQISHFYSQHEAMKFSWHSSCIFPFLHKWGLWCALGSMHGCKDRVRRLAYVFRSDSGGTDARLEWIPRRGNPNL
jgi:hypothetical protein